VIHRPEQFNMGWRRSILRGGAGQIRGQSSGWSE